MSPRRVRAHGRATHRQGDEVMPTIDSEHQHGVAKAPVEVARQEAVNDLAQLASSGGLTLGEYAERAVAIEQAATVEELSAAVRGVPEETAAATPARGARWLVGVFGGTEQRGRWRLSSQLRIVAGLGGVTLDLKAAQPEASESLITVVAVLGGAEIIGPAGVSIQLSGFSLLGGKSDERSGGPPLPGTPLIRVRCVTLLGGVKVKDRSPVATCSTSLEAAAADPGPRPPRPRGRVEIAYPPTFGL